MASMKAIVAVDRDWAIGKDGELLYHIPKDMEFFRDMTVDNTVVMGMKTFISIGSKSLPKRRNIILTHNYKKYRSTYKRIYTDCDEFDKMFKKDTTGNIYFIIGGEEIYKRYYKQCNEIFVTMINDESKDPDRYFPDLRYCKEFKMVDIIFSGVHNDIPFSITRWVKIV